MMVESLPCQPSRKWLEVYFMQELAARQEQQALQVWAFALVSLGVNTGKANQNDDGFDSQSTTHAHAVLAPMTL